MKLTFKGVDISTEEKFVSYINSLNTAIMKQNAMNEIKQDCDGDYSGIAAIDIFVGFFVLLLQYYGYLPSLFY